jgi:hypothetical protein
MSSASAKSSMRRIQRFMAGFDLPMKLISTFIFGILLEKKKNLILVLDRTNWKCRYQYFDAWNLL